MIMHHPPSKKVMIPPTVPHKTLHSSPPMLLDSTPFVTNSYEFKSKGGEWAFIFSHMIFTLTVQV